MKAVLDPNVLVSAFISFPHGTTGRLLLAWRAGAFELVVSNRLLYELESVLMREKFRRYATVSEVIQYILWLRQEATLAEEEEIQPLSLDPDDDYLFALARVSGADYLVSGDRHLFAGVGHTVPVEPRTFLDALQLDQGGTP